MLQLIGCGRFTYDLRVYFGTDPDGPQQFTGEPEYGPWAAVMSFI